jgi:hypothetical protein
LGKNAKIQAHICHWKDLEAIEIELKFSFGIELRIVKLAV